MVRAFIAIDVDEKTRVSIAKIQRELSESNVNLRNVDPANLHITMKFLGEVDNNTIDNIKTSLNDIASNFSLFRTSIEGLGVFPSLNYIRVLWAGVGVGSDNIINICQKIDKELTQFGFKKEKDYTPHVTVSRIKSAKNKSYLLKLVENNRKTFFSEFDVTSIVLKESKLTPKGPIYSNLCEVSF